MPVKRSTWPPMLMQKCLDPSTLSTIPPHPPARSGRDWSPHRSPHLPVVTGLPRTERQPAASLEQTPLQLEGLRAPWIHGSPVGAGAGLL